MNPHHYKILFFFAILIFIAMIVQSCTGEPCEEFVGKEQIQLSQSLRVDSIKIGQGRLFTKKEYDEIILYNSGWRHIEANSIDVTVYINSIATQMSFAVENNKTLHVTLSDTATFVCGSMPAYHSLKLNNAAACFYYDSLSCP